ncbi:MAG: plasmid stabilization protein [Aquificaceae bacterium]|nr:MAG: plasmid stabilization protein [Aquificaceae bacterium]
MSMLTIRNIEESLKYELRIKAAKQGVSMEEQARIILREALVPKKRKKGLGSKIHQYFVGIDNVELEIPKRTLPRPAPDFSEL